ncbi:MAG: Hsp20/alpha crystallin family protein [bacterium]
MSKRHESDRHHKEGKGIEIDLGTGQISLGGLFEGLEKLVEAAGKLKDLQGELHKEGEFDLSHLKQGMKGVYGVSVRTMAGKKPVVETFGNIKSTPRGPEVEEEREPMVDLFDEVDETVITAEMPGVEESEIQVELKGDVLDLTAGGKYRKYRKEMLLEVPVVEESMKTTFRNGILEVRLTKKKE